jgi:hypothetical protein
MVKTTTLTLNLDENNLRKAQNFFSKYKLVSMLGDLEKKFTLGNKSDRVCRFCGKTEAGVKFISDAHIIPEFMGNHNLLSYFECDSCNSIFSKYENSFANFMRITRTISQVKGKNNKIPKYKDFNLLRIFEYFIPGPPKYNKPFLQLYRKEDNKSTQNIPKYQLILYYSSYQFQMTLPFGKPDEHLRGQKIDLSIVPLFIGNSHLNKYSSEIFQI